MRKLRFVLHTLFFITIIMGYISIFPYQQSYAQSTCDMTGWTPGQPLPPQCRPGDDKVASLSWYDIEDIQFYVNTILNVMFGFLGILAVYFIVMNGFNMVAHSHNEQKAKEAQKGITWALVGLLGVILAYALATSVIRFVYQMTG